MCGRFAMALAPSQVRRVLENEMNMPVDDCPEDQGPGAPRQSYNFAPGNYGAVYRADPNLRVRRVPGHEERKEEQGREAERVDGAREEEGHEHEQEQEQPEAREITTTTTTVTAAAEEALPTDRPPYRLQSMKWGIIPSWSTTTTPNLKTINCRSESLTRPSGLWSTLKSTKRCIILTQGFYEWLPPSRPGGQKRPHYVKRKDGGLMCMAGLWESVSLAPHLPQDKTATTPKSAQKMPQQRGGSGEREENQRLFTFTIITVPSCSQLHFLHDRMPAIIDSDSVGMRAWLDTGKNKWSDELQAYLKPFEGELEVYEVAREVGKVGCDEARFILPLDKGGRGKGGIEGFFSAAGKGPMKDAGDVGKGGVVVRKVKEEEQGDRYVVVKKEKEEEIIPPTIAVTTTNSATSGIKREAPDTPTTSPARKKIATSSLATTPMKPSPSPSPSKTTTLASSNKRPKISATANTSRSSPSKKLTGNTAAAVGTHKITRFFKK